MTAPLAAVAVLSAAGAVNALYAWLIARGALAGGRWAGCPGGECGGGALRSGAGALLGLAPPVWGVLYNGGVLALTGLRSAGDSPALLGLQLAAGAVAALYGARLVWTMLIRVRRPCSLCWAALLLNLILLGALIGSAPG